MHVIVRPLITSTNHRHLQAKVLSARVQETTFKSKSQLLFEFHLEEHLTIVQS